MIAGRYTYCEQTVPSAEQIDALVHGARPHAVQDLVVTCHWPMEQDGSVEASIAPNQLELGVSVTSLPLTASASPPVSLIGLAFSGATPPPPTTGGPLDIVII
jgi:hypothetical protein